MNQRQLDVQKTSLADEKRIIRQLKQVYTQARKDCEAKIKALAARTDMQNLQTIVYQIQYQKALQQQIDGVLSTLQSNQFDKISDYLVTCYENGFAGALYDLHGQGIPVIFPIDQRKVVKALQVDSKISEGLYTRLGEDVSFLKKSIKAQLSRGAAKGSSWLEIAEYIANGMNSPFDKAINNAIRIARTEGHRVQQQAQMDTLTTAKSKGADVVKQWDSTLDGRTRPTHRQLDGQIRELEEPFTSGTLKAMYPGGFGRPSEDCNCRCCMLQRAKWALDDEELNELKKRAQYFGLDKTKDFEEFKKKWMIASKPVSRAQAKINTKKELSKEGKQIVDQLKAAKVKYLDVKALENPLTEDEIISKLAGGDMTGGSCSSLAFAYIANKNGFDVTDYRGGNSMDYFSRPSNIKDIASLSGVKSSVHEVEKELKGALDVLNGLEANKEYYFSAGKHAAIVRKIDGNLEYLEMQSGMKNGWMSFNSYGTADNTLTKRFGCRKTVDQMKVGSTKMVFKKKIFVMEVDSFKDCDDFREICGYINTASDKQKKGAAGHVR